VLPLEGEMTVTQAPIGTRFTAASTAADVLAGADLSGRTAIVTGGASGIGIETVRALTSAGAQVVVAARNVVAAGAPLADVSLARIEHVDLAEPESIDKFAAWFLGTGAPLDILINGAAVMGGALQRDQRGLEAHFATNHLGHFQLTARLWPALSRAAGRVVTIAASEHKDSALDFEDLQFDTRPYDSSAAYRRSKLANVLFTVALDARGAPLGLRAYSLHPGRALTPLRRHTHESDLRRLGLVDEQFQPLIDPARDLKTPTQAAATPVWCATSRLLDGIGGVYCENSDIAPVIERGSTVTTLPPGVSADALDPLTAERLWTVSEALSGVGFD
jgi:NAD(P)-dependent dehydrogenase (short-subunit alcohol dehydrogenase family)